MPSTKEATSEHASADINAFREKIRTGKRGSDHLYIMLLGMKMLETDENITKQSSFVSWVA